MGQIWRLDLGANRFAVKELFWEASEESACHDAEVTAHLEAAGIRLPSSCRNGTCRACIRRMAQGRVSYRIEWPGLLPEEKAEGFILPCVAYPESDLVLSY